MTRRTLELVDRRTREVRLRRAEVDFLLAHARGVIDVVPAFRRGVYRLTPRGVVGTLDGPGVRFAIRPKLPWADLLVLLGLESAAAPGGERVEPKVGLLAALAEELAARMTALARAGLVRGYSERDTESPLLRGRLRTAEQLRDAASRAFPDRFHVSEPVFDLDTPWNRLPVAAATGLVSHPDLPRATRDRLAAALVPFEGVSPTATDEDYEAATRDPRAAGYQAVLGLCRWIRTGLAAADPTAHQSGAFLLDLGRVFEDYLTRTFTATAGERPGWSVETQPRVVLGSGAGEPAVLQPDLVLRRRGELRAVLDAKWKAPGPTADDLHQILAYAAVMGATRVALVYPGRRLARRELAVPGSPVRVALVRFPVVGPPDVRRAAAHRLLRLLTHRRK